MLLPTGLFKKINIINTSGPVMKVKAVKADGVCCWCEDIECRKEACMRRKENNSCDCLEASGFHQGG